jgi:hypothetical protein
VAVARSEIRAVRQLPVEMLQHCSSASRCMQMCIVMQEHYAWCQHSTPLVWMALCSFFFHFTIQNVAELMGGRLLWHKHARTYSSIWQVQQFQQGLCWN